MITANADDVEEQERESFLALLMLGPVSGFGAPRLGADEWAYRESISRWLGKLRTI